MKKISRVWRAFCRGFWQAWLEIPPQNAKNVGELIITLTVDDSQFQRQTDEVIQRLQQIQRMTLSSLKSH
jgi:hypothetical protein